MSKTKHPMQQRTIQAPEGCGFAETPVIPVQIDMVCQKCAAPMMVTGRSPNLLLTQAAPTEPAFMYQCPGCGHKARHEKRFPTMRYEPMPSSEQMLKAQSGPGPIPSGPTGPAESE